MNTRGVIPLIDLGFLTLGAVVALLAQSEFVQRLPIDLAEGPATTNSATLGEHAAIDVTPDAVFVDGEAIGLDELLEAVSGRTPIVRPAREVDAERLIAVLARLAEAGLGARLEYAPAG